MSTTISIPTTENLNVLLSDIILQAHSQRRAAQKFFNKDGILLMRRQQAEDLFDSCQEVMTEGVDEDEFLVHVAQCDSYQLVAFDKENQINWYACQFTSADNVTWFQRVSAKRVRERISFQMYKGRLNY